MTTPPRLPLDGLIVLDLTLARAGPNAVRHLADWGASVIRVQAPDAGGEEIIGKRDGADYQNLHRNKRVISLDLKKPEGHAAFLKLVQRADVLIENMRTQVKHRLKISWDDLRPINPRLVYGSISGFGQTGPYAARPGVDQIVQGMGGLMSVTGEPGRGPMRAGAAISDMTAGNILAMGVMMALFDRERTGEGRWVSTSLLESQIHMLDFQAARYLANGDVAGQAGNEHPTVAPMNVFETADGHVNMSASSPAQWQRLTEVLGKPEWLSRREWATQPARVKDRKALNTAIAVEIVKQPTAYWVQRLDEAGLPCGPIYDIGQMFDDPQVKHLEVAADIKGGNGKRMLASPLTMEGFAKPDLHPAAISGVHTRDVLKEAGLSETEIADLAAKGVIG